MPSKKRVVKEQDKFDSAVMRTSIQTGGSIDFQTPPMVRLQSMQPEPGYSLSQPADLSLRHARSDVSDSNVKITVGGRWTDLEHRRFLEGLKMYGKDRRLIE